MSPNLKIGKRLRVFSTGTLRNRLNFLWVSGTTLLEMMLTLFLSTLLTTGLIEHYLLAKKQFLQAQDFLDYTFELQLIQDLIRNSLRHAGFTPCLNINRLLTRDSRTKQTLTAIKINQEGNQNLVIFRMSEVFNRVRSFPNPNQLLIKNNSSYQKTDPYKKDQWILVADCYHAETQQIAAVQYQEKNTLIYLKQPLHFNYSKISYLGEWIEESFYVQKNSLNQFALYYKINHAEELASNIKKISTDLFSHFGKTLVKVTLETKDPKAPSHPSQPLTIETTIRSS